MSEENKVSLYRQGEQYSLDTTGVNLEACTGHEARLFQYVANAWTDGYRAACAEILRRAKEKAAKPGDNSVSQFAPFVELHELEAIVAEVVK